MSEYMHKYLYPHIGLGDLIICNGLIRACCKKFDKITTFCKPWDATSVKFMFRDVSNLEILELDDPGARKVVESQPLEQQVILGLHGPNPIRPKSFETGSTFDELFYQQVGLDFNKRWSEFYVERDVKKEKEFFNTLNLTEGEYIFVHDDHSRGFRISDDRIVNKNLKVFRPSKELTDNVFDYCYLIENAKEIHCMDSTFKHITDSLNPSAEKLFYHIAIRGVTPYNITKSRLNWEYVK